MIRDGLALFVTGKTDDRDLNIWQARVQMGP